ncbi:MAG TPA: hypothetical protein VHM00_15955 [Caldimonas sp.]|jgi:hypothetical protein|nr:hypothetical protein [Caldimonas sp.]HEX2542565.1 hypothetical protein [Caldimonas sp.]
MSSVSDRIVHFIRWFFNASPTELITLPQRRDLQPQEARSGRYVNQQQRVSQ